MLLTRLFPSRFLFDVVYDISGVGTVVALAHIITGYRLLTYNSSSYMYIRIMTYLYKPCNEYRGTARNHLIQEWKVWRKHVTTGVVYLVSWDWEKGRGVTGVEVHDIFSWAHSLFYLSVPYSISFFTLVISVCVASNNSTWEAQGFFCTCIYFVIRYLFWFLLKVIYSKLCRTPMELQLSCKVKVITPRIRKGVWLVEVKKDSLKVDVAAVH